MQRLSDEIKPNSPLNAEASSQHRPRDTAEKKDTTPVGGAWMCLRDGGLYYATDDFLSLLGITLRQARGWGWSDQIVPRDAPALTRWRDCVDGGREWRDKLDLRSGVGKIHHMTVHARVLHDENQLVVGWLVTHEERPISGAGPSV